jgi:hypothetical protein
MMSLSWRKSPNSYAEQVIEVVRLIVAADRQAGMKTIASLETRAPELLEQPRRLRRLFERDRVGFIGADELGRFLLLGARVLRQIAQRHRELAAHADEQAAAFEARHRQMNLWGNGGTGWVGYDVRKQRRAA